MNILLLGATGQIGSRVRDEAVSRGHRVTAVARDTSDLEPEERLQCESADASDADAVNHLAGGHDVVVAALSPRGEGGADTYLDAIRTVLDVTEQSDPERVLIVGGAGSLQTPSGTELVDTPAFPDPFKDEARAVREARDIARDSDANWTVLSPAAVIESGERTGTYRTGGTRLLTDDEGDSRISFEDFAGARARAVHRRLLRAIPHKAAMRREMARSITERIRQHSLSQKRLACIHRPHGRSG